MMDRELFRKLNAAQVAALNPDTPEQELRDLIIWLVDGMELSNRVIETQKAVIDSYKELEADES